jgi:membrane protein implicated in regulation of membrane protease activity
MNQTKLGSFYESIINILIGAIVALVSQLIIFPLYSIEVSLNTNFGIMVWFTVISVVRSYVVRRWFNKRLQQVSRVMTGAA